MSVRIHLVTWNGQKYIPSLFESLRSQTMQDYTLCILDNGSTDGTLRTIEQELENFTAPYDLLKRSENTGFAPAHNWLMRQAQTPYVLLLNQDIFLMPEYLERLKAHLDAHPRVGACTGRLMRWEFPRINDATRGFTQQVDSLGLQVMRSRRVVDAHTGKRWDEVAGLLRHDPTGGVPVFGVSGTVPLYRSSAIQSVLLDGQMFDEEYFSYKEDVDLAWRLRIAGWEAYVVPTAVAYHDRSAAGPRELSDAAASENRKNKSALANYHSYKNHLFTLIKNEFCANYLRDWPWIEWYEWKKFLYLLLLEFRTWRAWGEILRRLPSMLRKRRQVQRMRAVAAHELRPWWCS